jgi:uncharacterized protein (TIGR03067 family)
VEAVYSFTARQEDSRRRPNKLGTKPTDAKSEQADRKLARVGQIFIVGNTKTSAEAISKKLALFPGAVLDFRVVRKAEQDLAKLNAKIIVIDNSDDAPFKDILVKVEERPNEQNAGKGKQPKTDLDQLQGIWSVVSTRNGGKFSKAEAVFMVDGKRACFQTKDSEIQGGLYLEPNSKPKTFDLAMSTRTIEGIYSLDGDTLRLCYSPGAESKRPNRFTSEEGSQQVLVVLKRIHGPEVFPFRLPDGTRAFPTLIERPNTKQPPTNLDLPNDPVLGPSSNSTPLKR